VSHEIRTPLNAMSGAAALLAGTSPLNDEQRSLLQLLDAAAETVISVVDDVLQHGALTSGNFSVAVEPLLLLRDVLDPAWSMIALQPARRDKLASLRLSRHVAQDVPEAVLGDSTRLLQIVVNLLGNSIKFTPEGGTIELRVTVTRTVPPGASLAAPDSDCDWLQLLVVDDGIGIEVDKLERIFKVRERPSRAAGLHLTRVFAPAF